MTTRQAERELARARIERLRELQNEFPTLDSYLEAPIYIGTVAIIGADNASGFGANLGVGIQYVHPDNKVILTGTGKGKKLALFEERVKSGNTPLDPARTTVIKYDVTDPGAFPTEIDALVNASAYMKPEALAQGVRYEDIPQEVIDESREVVVYGHVASVRAAIFSPNASSWAVSFAGHGFPGYNIGPLKSELESAVLAGDTLVEGVRQNVLRLGVFESVAVMALNVDIARVNQGMKDLGLENPSLSQMVYGSIRAIYDTSLDRKLIHLDGGLGLAIANGLDAKKASQIIGMG